MTGSSIYGYRLLRLLGAGGMADIYYAENSLGKPAAVKILKLKYSDEQAVHDRFISEAKTTVKLHHPNIREIYDLGEIQGRPAILMEYLDGQSLWEVLRDEGKVYEEKELEWFQQTASGLQYAHKRGVIHRDIKPSNLFLTDDGKIKILDFGIAKVKENITMTQTGQTLGTLTYMSPEQVMDPKRVDERTDIYSLGVTFYHLLTGKMPYDITTDSGYVIQKKIVEEELDLEIVPPFWIKILSACLEKNLDKRSFSRIKKIHSNNRESEIDIPKNNSYSDETLMAVPPERIAKSPNLIDDILNNIKNNKIIYLTTLLILPVLIFGLTRFVTEKRSEELMLEPYLDTKAQLWGFKDKNGIKVPPKYEKVSVFSEDLCWVKDQGQFGFINSLGNEVIAAKYDTAWDFSNGLAIVSHNNKYGFIDKTGQEIVPVKYDAVSHFTDGLSKVELNSKSGFVNRNGNVVVPLVYDKAWPFSEGMAAVRIGDKRGFIDSTGKIKIPIIYGAVWSFSEGLAAVRINDKWRFVNKKNNVVLPFKFDYAVYFSEGLAPVRIGDKYGFIDHAGDLKIPLGYDKAWIFSDSLAAVSNYGKIGYIDHEDKIVIPFQYDYAETFFNGRAIVERNNTRFTINLKGERIYDEEL